MSIRTREANVVDEQDLLTPFLKEHLPAHRNPLHFEWLYHNNPFGRGRAWIAQLEDRGGLVGVAAAFPRLVHVRGQEVMCWNLGDFAIQAEYRSLGPAVQLQRRCLQDVSAGDVAFAYDHPSCNMMAVYRWLKIVATGDVVRFAKPLRVDGRVERYAGTGFVARGISGIGNRILSLADGRRMARGKPTAAVTSGVLDEKFRAFDRQLARSHAVVGVRSPEYLRWRYLDNPHARYEILVASEGDVPGGYAVHRCDEKTASVADLVCSGGPSVLDALLSRLVDTLKRTETRTLNVPVLETSPLIPDLERWGFKPRQRSAFVVSTRQGGPLDGTVNEAKNWYHTDGDRDV